MNLLRLALAVSVLALTTLAADQPATPAEPPPKTMAEALQRAGVKVIAGPTTVPVGKVSEIKVPAGYHFIGPDSLDRFYEATHNVRSGHEVGVLLAPKNWMLFFDYDEIGYVKDDDKDQLEADKLFKTMSENQEAANADRQKRGWDAMKLVGWATPPHYDPNTHYLKWAINLSSAQDNFKEVWVNENIRLLGRGGVMNVTLVSNNQSFKGAEAAADQMLGTNFSYVAGSKYSEFKTGDKIAAYGLGALVLGGGAAIAAKTGLLAKLGVLLLKVWKLVVVAAVAVGSFFVKLWKKITGAGSNETMPPAPGGRV